VIKLSYDTITQITEMEVRVMISSGKRREREEDRENIL